MENSHISWTNHTFNPWIGCTKVSPGCVHCYAEARDQRFAGGAHWGSGAPRQRTSAANWKQPLKWNKAAADAEYNHASEAPLYDEEELAPYERPRVFCASLADWLDKEAPVEWLADLLLLIHQTPNLDWLLLSKRPHLWRDRVRAAQDKLCNVGSIPRDCADDMVERWIAGQPPRNVWIGTTVEDQTRADERIPELVSIPAQVRFLSCEPLLEELDLMTYLDPIDGGYVGRSFIDWIICGGESGPGARPMHPEWARSLRDQCAESGVPYHFKQWGGPDNKERGRLLDGELHDALPRLSNNDVSEFRSAQET